MDKILAWHFTDGMKLRDGRKVAVGKTNHHKGDIALCRSGLHASRDPYDALQYAPGTTLCRVECWGDIEEQDDKLVCRHREVIAVRDIERELRLFACWSVRHTPLAGGGTIWGLPLSSASKQAVIVAEKFAMGNATPAELRAARAAAWAARDATMAAAWAARAAARAAAMDAARVAAMDAARVAAMDAGDAGDAARGAQRVEFNRMIGEIFGEEAE